MKLPKLKYYYLAMNGREYHRFESTRQVLVNEPAEINIQTGAVTQSRPFHYLYAQATTADTRYRQLTQEPGSVWVLRIPSQIIPRVSLEATEDPRGMWLCRANLAIAHCGVERFDQVEPEVKAQIIATSKKPAEKK